MWQLDYGNGPRGRQIADYRVAQRWATSERRILRNPGIRVVRVGR